MLDWPRGAIWIAQAPSERTVAGSSPAEVVFTGRSACPLAPGPSEQTDAGTEGYGRRECGCGCGCKSACRSCLYLSTSRGRHKVQPSSERNSFRSRRLR